MTRRFAVGFAVALLVAAPGAALADPITQTVEEHRDEVGEIDRRGDVFVHRPSGYVFPANLGDMPARKTTTYGRDDAALYYTLLGGGGGDAWLTLYVYRSGLAIPEEVASVEAALKQNMPDFVQARPSGLPPLPKGVIENWYDGTYQGIALTNGYRLARDGDWYVKVRLSIPRSGDPGAFSRARAALEAISWSVPGKSTSVPATVLTGSR